MIGLIRWTRSFTYGKDGNMVKNETGPVFAAHPQPNLWTLLAADAASDSQHFDLIQLPPATKGAGEGYGVFCLRDYNSNWGTKAELVAAIEALHAAGMCVSLDLVYRQMSGENGGPGVFNYHGEFPGDTTASWFQFFGQNGETMPPFVDQDSVPDASGNYAFGRVRSYQNSVPAGIVEADTTSALADIIVELGIVKGKDYPRLDDCKGFHAPSLLRILESQPGLGAFGEFDSGNPAELYWYVHTIMGGRLSVEDYAQYWNTQRACNGYDARQFDAGHGGYVQWDSSHAVGFTNNPDVATSWSPTGGISQQIAFNLLLGIAHDTCLPFRLYLVYAEDYFPASPDYPTGRGLKPFIDNMCYFSRTFAFGKFERVWQDRDVYGYTRDGDGGEYGRSGGCMVLLNFNTLNQRPLSIKQNIWEPGKWLHDHSLVGGATHRDFQVNQDWTVNVTLKANSYSNGQSFCLIAPGENKH